MGIDFPIERQHPNVPGARTAYPVGIWVVIEVGLFENLEQLTFVCCGQLHGSSGNARAGRVTEQLALDQRLRHGGAIQRNKWRLTAALVFV